MKPLIVHPDAESELRHEATYYEDREEGLGLAFQRKVQDAFDRIKRNPEGIKRRQGPFRKCFLVRFPFSVIFREYPTFIHILTLKHHKRDDEYWKHRTPED
jgi:plasmid stabilization system protein ParE